ncbi:MAG: thioredoxin family protein [Chitinophagaceae bacterium]|nr:thioredoxin family protein [Chitinophagaceae bacterium]
MKKILVIIFCLSGFFAGAQTAETKLYHPDANAAKDIATAVKKAKAEKKYVLVQGGGNWCSWCIEFARFCQADKKIDSVINSSFVWLHLNYSKENYNKAIFAKYGYPQRFGFPVFLILDEKGELIHTQNSEYFEDGKKSYDREKVQSFLEKWSPGARDPKKYSD